MSRRLVSAGLLSTGLLISSLLAGQVVEAQDVIHEEWRTVAAAGTPAPLERDVHVTIPGDYVVELTDLGAAATPTPAPLASVHVALTKGKTVVGTPLTAPGTLPFTSVAGADYTVRVTGAPGNVPGSGLVRVQVRPAAGGAAILDFIDVLAVPPAAPNNDTYVFDAGFTVPATGSYDLALRDLVWPRAFPTLIMAVLEEGGPLVATFSTAGTNPDQQAATLDAGKQYHVFAIAVPDTTTADIGGVYSISVRAGGGGAAALDRVVPIGAVASLGSATLTAGTHELVLTDLQFPAALARAGANVVRDGQSVAATLAGGTTTFTASAGVYEVFGFGEAAATPGGGSLRAQLRPQGGADVLSAVHAVTLAGSGLTAFEFDGPITAGNFRVRLADYQFPAAFTSVTAAATQGAGLLGTKLDVPGNTDITAAAGRVQVLVFARAPAAGGLFGIDVTPAAGTGPVPLEITQGVGAAFTARKISINADGRYDVDLADMMFPAAFTDLAAAVTRGADRVGFIFGGGKFSFDATRGNYFVNFVAKPSAPANAGTYALAVSSTPPAPTLTFSASPATVRTGQTTSLTWTATNATGCTASNGWTGTKTATGTETTATLTATASFTLNCAGAGGNVSKTITVDVSPSAGGGSSKGGGGSFELATLALLASLCVLAAARRRRPLPRQ
ncbi:MAG TPA: hypothetical protein VMF52_11825 [Steroidobacteraceae bacterium]|nr:hypothetical protein [Steroidobacteraceae bacterium]